MDRSPLQVKMNRSENPNNSGVYTIIKPWKEIFSMSYQEIAKSMIERLPEDKMIFVINMLEDLGELSMLDVSRLARWSIWSITLRPAANFGLG